MSIPRKRYNDKKKRRAGTEAGKTGRRKSRFKRGFYEPMNESKYVQPMDKTMNSAPLPEYRSSWELKFYKWCDYNENIEYWGTESVHIKYISPKDGEVHRYYPDVFIKFITGEKYIVEIKPAAQVNSPINQAKFEAAEKYANVSGCVFVVMTEKDLGI